MAYLLVLAGFACAFLAFKGISGILYDAYTDKVLAYSLMSIVGFLGAIASVYLLHTIG